MEAKHKELITHNLTGLVRAVDYDVIREHVNRLRIFPPAHLKRLDERNNPCLDFFVEIQRRGPTAFRRLLVCLKLSGCEEALDILTRDQDSAKEALSNLSSCVLTERCPVNVPSITQNIDLTDSPIHPNQISVLEAPVYRAEDNMTYKMSSSPRGFCLIIDNEDYDSLPPRRGSHVDSECLVQLFRQLGFWVCVKKNLTKAKFEYEVLNFATDTMHGYTDMSVVCILSHGENGTIICTNGEKIEIEAILNRFNNQAAPSLRGKPKFFLLQSCRGLDIDAGIETDGPTSQSAQPPPAPNRSLSGENMADLQQQSVGSLGGNVNLGFQHSSVINTRLPRSPSYEDMIISYATIPGYVAYRNNVKGSWFIQSICKIFMEHCHEEDLVTLMQRVSQELSTYGTVKGEKQMCETLLRGLKKKIYFNPGLADRNRVYTNAEGPDPSPRLNLVLIEEPAPTKEKSISDQEIDRVWSQIV
eukprot:TRINITY_DN8041_c0_g1_i1.p1 TRINITY_DN8041_c0_g1~~TRINITY_DN8041_c0_g1_i1.p1  ORF type:complete len:472 (+),score=102.62 TRINITY_DN8041_c0_g1_i1:123-1538(+)